MDNEYPEIYKKKIYEIKREIINTNGVNFKNPRDLIIYLQFVKKIKPEYLITIDEFVYNSPFHGNTY